MTVRYQALPIRLPQIKRITHCMGEGVGKQARCYTAGRRVNGCNFFMDRNLAISLML